MRQRIRRAVGPEDLERLAPELELAIFRLVQECLTNIHRHSGSKTAAIRIAREPDKIHVEVQGQGKGMSQERLAEVQSQGVGVGIRGMRERVRQSHGELTIIPMLWVRQLPLFSRSERSKEWTPVRFRDNALPDCLKQESNSGTLWFPYRRFVTPDLRTLNSR
jgi:hypothetical protein